MTALLQRAVEAAGKLPAEEQDVLATWLLAEVEDDELDQKIAANAGKLADMARAALAEFDAGETELLEPDRL